MPNQCAKCSGSVNIFHTSSRGAEDHVVLLVTGDGLKTPDPIAERLQPVEIDADADALLERLGVGT